MRTYSYVRLNLMFVNRQFLKNVFERRVLLPEVFDKQQPPYGFNRPP